MSISREDSRRILTILSILIFLVFLPGLIWGPVNCLAAEGQEDLDRKKYLRNYPEITLEAGMSLIPDDSTELRKNLILASLLSTSFLLDQGVRDFVQDNLYFGDNILSRTLYNLGNPDYILPGYLLAGGYSYLSADRYLQDSLLLSLQSLIITQVYTGFFKSTVARTRPRYSSDNPFERGEGGRSFFSGHAAGSWAVMTVLAARYPDYSLPFYGLAASVAGSRIYEDAHWFSDVLLGSFVGYGVGKLTIKMNNGLDDEVLLVPVLEKNLAGIGLQFNF